MPIKKMTSSSRMPKRTTYMEEVYRGCSGERNLSLPQVKTPDGRLRLLTNVCA
jgi:hypothetical protein